MITKKPDFPDKFSQFNIFAKDFHVIFWNIIIVKDWFPISASHANIHFCASRANIPNLGLTYYTRLSTHDRPQLKPHLCKAIGKIWKAKQKSKTFVKTREAKQKSKTEKQNYYTRLSTHECPQLKPHLLELHPLLEVGVLKNVQKVFLMFSDSVVEVFFR